MKTIALITLVILLNPASCRRQKSATPSGQSSNGASNVTDLTNPSPTPVDTNSSMDVVIDFESCAPRERSTVYVDFGSTTYEIIGKSESGCVMKYGGEVENPRWDGFLDKTCTVPFKLGTQRFRRTQVGVDFSTLEEYCKPTPRTDR